MIRIAVLASGNGTNFQAIAESLKASDSAKVCMLLTDVKTAHVRTRARRLCIPDLYVDPKRSSNRLDFDKALVKILKKEKIDIVVLAGFMRVLSPYFVGQFKNKILNIHPALLPAFPGVDAIQQAHAYGVKVAGVTVHLVDELVDHGPILMQAAFVVSEGMTVKALEAKIHALEHRLYPRALKLFIEKKFMLRGRHAQIR